MESLRQFVQAGGSVREFSRFHDSVGQAVSGLREGLTKRGLRTIDHLFSGGTSEEGEDRALAIILGTHKAENVMFLINELTWGRLDDELDESDLDQIALHLSRLLDDRDYRVNAILRRAFLSDAPALIARSDNELRAAAATIPFEVRQELADEIVHARNRFLDGVALMALRGLPTHVREFRVLIDFIQSTGHHHPAQLSQITWELFYTERICSQLSRGEVSLLLRTLPELLDLAQPAARRIAHHDMLRRWEREFVALEEIVKALGNGRQKTDMRRFMEMRRLFIDNFPPPPQQPDAIQQAIQAVLNALGGVAGGIQELRGALETVAQAIDDLSVPNLFGTDADDLAVMATNELHARGLLQFLPFTYKLELIKRMVGTGTDAVEDDEEQAALKILRASKDRSAAEFLQLAAGRSWEILFGAFEGAEYDDLEKLFVF